ncbi:MAG: hypothetical protein ABW032_08950 [Burkholderiaceae bacterium]
MRPVRVDFARPSRWPGRWIVALGVVIGLVSCWQGELAWRAWHRLAESRERTLILQTALDAAVGRLRRAEASASAPAYARDALAIARTSSFDVGGALRSVEAAQMAGAKTVSIDIDAESRTVSIDLEVAHADMATAYVEALNAGDDRRPWTLSRLQAQGGGALAAIRGEFP